ncbi:MULTISPECIES: GntR family transcriptional regulator [Amycolatopsis]|uniref:DNA-binding transcriptional regulator, GntR family n=2 Tax=Amycolatopsis TaxID=1813 RepID=A0A1I4AJ38_9PSEU|nr:GntR family transcriptional regulator [Amycolatopsis sacchari]SFK56283.1 DNA-binding transcriptional regulator, GntR family [Amycolatopsis sacchari]
MNLAARSGAAGATHVRNSLRRAIVTGDLVPGQRIVAAEVGTALGATRSCVRQALHELAAEGLIDRVRGSNARVRAVPIGEVVEILECRQVLDGLLAARAAVRATDEEHRRLRAAGNRLAAAAERGEPVECFRLGDELHDLVVGLSRHPTAAGIVSRLDARVARLRFRVSLRPGRLRDSAREHAAIVQAVAGRHPVAAERAAREHVRSLIAAIVGHHEKEPLC